MLKDCPAGIRDGLFAIVPGAINPIGLHSQFGNPRREFGVGQPRQFLFYKRVDGLFGQHLSNIEQFEVNCTKTGL